MTQTHVIAVKPFKLGEHVYHPRLWMTNKARKRFAKQVRGLTDDTDSVQLVNFVEKFLLESLDQEDRGHFALFLEQEGDVTVVFDIFNHILRSVFPE